MTIIYLILFINLFINFASQAGRAPQQLYASYCGPFILPTLITTQDNNIIISLNTGNFMPCSFRRW